jgi:class 3 adenylate cyclase/tetratricopeptide (TPR) repeat protein
MADRGPERSILTAAPLDESPPVDAAGETRDNPEAYIARDRRRALADRVEMADRVRGAGLFADISGFTPLTEALAGELGSQRGSEELTANLDRVFHAVIAEVDAYGGDVIYFSGDAITCWIDGDDGSRATAAAVGIQEAMDRVGTITTPNGTTVRLAVKVAVAVGEARRFVVGDPTIQLIDVLAGHLVDDLAEAEHHADKGEVVLDPSAIAALGDRVRLGETRIDEESGRVFAVLEELKVAVTRQAADEPPPLEDELVRPWLLPAVWDRIRAGRGEFLAELRPAYPVFVRFGGIDYDEDDGAIEKLDTFVRRAQQIMAGFGGNVLQLTLGDKGAYLYGVFGSPTAHEDDAARAAAAALELRDLERTTDATGIQIGIGHGRLRSGTYGHRMRRTFVCLGDAVNLSARLMSKAPEGAIYVSDDVRLGAGDAYLWEALPNLVLKGKSAPVVAHALTGSLEGASRRKLRYELPLIGRLEELELLDDALARSIAGAGAIVAIAAEAGTGKSRLVAEFVRMARRRGLFVGFGECQSFGSSTGYFVWREIWRRLFRVDEDDPEPKQIATLEADLASIDPGLVARAPLLDGLLGLAIPDSELTAAFDAKLRKSSLEALLVEALRARAGNEPIVLVLEDCHWIDELSRDLLETLARAAASLPVLIVLAYRPAAAPGGGLGLERMPSFTERLLDHLGPAEAADLIRSKLEQVSGAEASASESLVALVTERSGGNPFYIEELVTFIASQGIDPTSERAVRDIELPESLHSLVLGRIDTIGEGPRRTLKVASVVGRTFEAPVLPGAYPELGPLDEVVANLGILRAADLVNLDREAEQAWLFKHVVTQEVAYESLPFAVREMLHGRIGRHIEETAGDAIDRQLDLLAYHFWRGDDEVRKRDYLGRAADAAREAYANSAAIDYYERLVPMLEQQERVATMLKLAKVLQVVGELARAQTVAAEAGALAANAGYVLQVAWADASLAETAKRQSRFEEATARLDTALGRFRDLQADAGVGDMLHLAGVIAQLQGDYATAGQRYQESRSVREGIGDLAGVATTDGNLAILAEFDGDYAAALELNDGALALRRRIGDRRGIGIGEMNAGYYRILTADLQSARAHLEEALRLSRELGDRAMVAHSTFTLGNAERDLGDHRAAAARYAEALELQRELDDRFSLTFILEDVGVLLAAAGEEEEGFELLGGAEAVRGQIGSPRPPTLDLELAAHFATARQTLGDDVADAAVARGRGWTFDEAVDAAIGASARVAVERVS